MKYRIINEAEYIHFPTIQNVSDSSFMLHTTHKLNRSTDRDLEIASIIEKMVKDIDVNRRSNMRITARNTSHVSTLLKHFKLSNPSSVHATSSWVGGYPVILAQDEATKLWKLYTGYGIAEGIDVRIKKSHEFTLRTSMMVGWIYWLGIGKFIQNSKTNMSSKENMPSINTLLHNRETIWPWTSLNLQIWGMESAKGGVVFGGKRWMPMYNMVDTVRVDNSNVVSGVSPTPDMDSKEWKKWLYNEFTSGKCVNYAIKEGTKFVFQRGTYTDVITEQEFIDIKNKVTLNIRHGKDGRILYMRT